MPCTGKLSFMQSMHGVLRSTVIEAKGSPIKFRVSEDSKSGHPQTRGTSAYDDQPGCEASALLIPLGGLRSQKIKNFTFIRPSVRRTAAFSTELGNQKLNEQVENHEKHDQVKRKFVFTYSTFLVHICVDSRIVKVQLA